jgi:hypothetical protein
MSRMIVVSRNGKTIVYTGWRAWLAGAACMAVAFAVLALIVFVLLGVAITVGALLLLLIPAAIVMSLVAMALGVRRVD